MPLDNSHLCLKGVIISLILLSTEERIGQTLLGRRKFSPVYF